MRVIAGEFRSRKLLAPEGLDTRPTPDRLRETLFNILAAELEGRVFVDAYAGSGSVGIEAISRGVRLAVFIEKDRRAVEVIQQNLAVLKAEQRARVIRGPVLSNLPDAGGDIVFLDPPFPKEREYRAALEVLEAHPPGLVVVQHPVRFSLAESYGPLTRTRLLKQGDNALSFFRS